MVPAIANAKDRVNGNFGSAIQWAHLQQTQSRRCYCGEVCLFALTGRIMRMLPQNAAHLREQPTQEILKVRWSVQLFDKVRALPLKSQATLIISDICRFENLQ